MALGTDAPTGAVEAAARLESAARAVVWTWRLVLMGVCSFVVLAALLVASTAVFLHPGYVPFTLMVLAGTVYNVTRFIPRIPAALEPRIVLDEQEAADLVAALTSRTGGWVPDGVVLTAETAVWIDPDGRLEMGFPLLVCLRVEDVAVLVEEALERHRVAATPQVSKALRIARGQIGRWIRDGGSQSASRVLLARLDARRMELARAHENWVEVHLAQVPTETRDAMLALERLEDAWWHFAGAFLVPAGELGYRHREPFRGLRAFLAAAHAARLTDAGFLAPRSLSEDFGLTHHELALSPSFGVLDAEVDAGHNMIGWAQHADLVSVPGWRQLVLQGIFDVGRVVGEPRPATVATFIELLEGGWGTTLASLRHEPLPDGDDVVSTDSLHPLLAAVVALATLEAPGTSVEWRWPLGACVVTADGVEVPCDAVAQGAIEEVDISRSCGEMRAWLRALGVDTTAPLWLGDGPQSGAAAVVGAFVASRRLTRRSATVVVSRAAVRIVDHTYVDAVLRDVGMRMQGPSAVLDPILEAAARGDIPGEQVVPVREIAGAELTSIVGGMFWKLRIRTVDDRVVLYGSVRVIDVFRFLAPVVGDRLTTSRVFLPDLVQTVRYLVSLTCIGLGGTLLATSLLAPLLVDATGEDAAATALIGVALVVLAFLPDAVHTLIRRSR